MIFEFDNYSSYLSGVLEERKKTNPAYSLRAMAKHVGISPSTLSDVISGKKNLSEQTAVELSSRLQLTGRKARYFRTLVQYQTTKNDEIKSLLASQLKVLNPKLRAHFEITADRFNLIAEWYHTAILEMTYLEKTPMTPEHISDALGISITQAKDALNLLMKLELLEPAASYRYKKTKKQLIVQSDIPNQALRRYHHQMLTKAQTSLVTQTPQEKLVGSETIPISSEDFNEANEIIEACFQRIIQLSERSKNKNHVYHLGIQFFKLTEGIK